MSNTVIEIGETLGSMSDTKADPYQDAAFNQPHRPWEPVEHEHELRAPEMQFCVDDCQHCHDICLSEAMSHCVEPRHMRLMISCAEMCQTAANFMVMNSPLYAPVCAACAQVCHACAVSCDAVQGMAECADQCRKCAESCQRMAQTVAAI
jgi:hypothetical protein